jgi:hypothetical protein
MKTLIFQTPILEQHYKLPTGLFQFNNHAIVDNEISNDISDDWDYLKGKPVCVGVLTKDSIEIYLAESPNDNDFHIVVMDKLLLLAEKGFLYSFNAEMEHGNFKGNFGIDIPVQEIKPFKGKGWNKDRFFQELINRKVIPTVKIFDPLNGESSRAVSEWKNYLANPASPNPLLKIAFHNLACLLKEIIILKNKEFFQKNWVLDNNGFMLNEKK